MKYRSAGGVVLGLILGLAILWVVLTRLQEASVQGVMKTPPAGWTVYRPPNDVHALALGENIIVAGGKDGVMILDMQSGNGFEPLDCGTELKYVRALLIDSHGTLWIGHDKGLTRKDANECITLTDKEGLPDLRVNALLQDSAGNIWVGTWGGVAVQMDGKWNILTAKDGLLADMVSVIMEDEKGGIWFGSAVAPQGGVSILNNGRWQYLSKEEGLPHNSIQGIEQDTQGYVWAATGLLDRGGTVRIKENGGQWTVDQIYDKQNGMAGNKGRSLMVDQAGRLWVGSEYDGLSYQTRDGWQILTNRDGLSHNEIMVMKQDPSGNLWIGTRDGITKINQGVLVY